MATSPKSATNAQHSAFPSLFKRTGEARRIKGFRASRETFNRAMRLAKALDNADRLTVYTPVGAMVLSKEATELLKTDGGVAALILNGFEIQPMSHSSFVDTIDTFLSERGIIELSQNDMFEAGEE